MKRRILAVLLSAAILGSEFSFVPEAVSLRPSYAAAQTMAEVEMQEADVPQLMEAETDAQAQAPAETPTDAMTEAPAAQAIDALSEIPVGETPEELSGIPVGESMEEPAETPTEEPTEGPTDATAETPAEEPTEEPTETPAEEPTEEPTQTPAQEPTDAPTEAPVEEPTETPVEEPGETPAGEVTAEPTEIPAQEPTEEPTAEPTEEPTAEPTEEPEEADGDLFTVGYAKVLEHTRVYEEMRRSDSCLLGRFFEEGYVYAAERFGEGDSEDWMRILFAAEVGGRVSIMEGYLYASDLEELTEKELDDLIETMIEDDDTEMTEEGVMLAPVEFWDASMEFAAEPTEEPVFEATEEPDGEEQSPFPTEDDESEPTAEVTEEPVAEPTVEATEEPTAEPTVEATEEPTAEPTVEATEEPTDEPTAKATEEPTPAPGEEEEIYFNPNGEEEIYFNPAGEMTAEATEEPVAEPTAEATEEPVAEPTVEATEEPVAEPTVEATEEPVAEPTAEATEEPVAEPTVEVTEEPVAEPTIEVMEEPTAEPTAEVTEEPTPAPGEEEEIYFNPAEEEEIYFNPTGELTFGQTEEPVAEPIAEPTVEVTEEPIAEPTAEATEEPTAEPEVQTPDEAAPEVSAEPTAEPEATQEPVVEPTAEATEEPIAEPTVEPAAEPEVQTPDEAAPEVSAEPTVEPEVQTPDEAVKEEHNEDAEQTPGEAMPEEEQTPGEAMPEATPGEAAPEATPGEAVRAEGAYTCGLAEHAHGETCYDESGNLICGLAEHAHDETCLADYETAADWEATFAHVALTDDLRANVVGIARSQLGYTESELNYIIDSDGVRRGYTRYGQWLGFPYAQWSTMFASFSLHYGGADSIPARADAGVWLEDFINMNLYEPAALYTPQPGDVVFLDHNADGEPDHAAIVESADTAAVFEQTATPGEASYEELAQDGALVGVVKTISGDVSGSVQYVDYALAGAKIVGYGKLPMPSTYVYSDENVYVEVTLPAGSTVPDDAVLSVTPIGTKAEGYNDYLALADAAVEGNVSDIALYDISFSTADGEYYPVSDTAKVVMGFTESPVDPAGDVQVLHFEKDNAAPEAVSEVSVAEKDIDMIVAGAQPAVQEEISAMTFAATMLRSAVSLFSLSSDAQETAGEAAEQTAQAVTLSPADGTAAGETTSEKRTVIEFKTRGFSTFAVVQVETGAYKAEIIDPNTSNNVVNQNYHTITGYGGNGKQYIIASADMKYVLSGYAYVADNGEDKLRGMEVLQSEGTAVGDDVYVNANKHLLWEFENTQNTGLIYIKNVATGEYLELVRAGVAITSELTGVSNDAAVGVEGWDPDDKQMIHVFEDDDSHKVGFAVNVGGTYYYLNRDGGGANYHTWTSSFEGSVNNQFYLCEYKETVKDLSGMVQNPSVNIGEHDMVSILAGVNYNSQYAGNDNPGMPTILTGEAAANQDIQTGPDNAADNDSNLKHVTGEIATQATYQGNAVYFLSHKSNNPHLWVFEETEDENVYNIRLAGTQQYLHLDETGLYVEDGVQNITLDVTEPGDNRVVQNDVIHLTAKVTDGDGNEKTYYAFLNGNDYNANDAKDFTAIYSYKGRTERENNPTTPGAEDASHLVKYDYGELVDGLEGKAYVISGVNNKLANGNNDDNARITAAMLTPVVDNDNTGLPTNWNGLKSTTNNDTLDVTDGTVTNLTFDADKKASDYAWAFEDVGYGTYHIRSLVTGQYLNIDQHSLTMSDNPQVIEVIAAEQSTQAMTVTENIVCLRNQENEYVLLYNNQLGNAFTGQLSSPNDKLEANRGTELILTEYKATENSSVLATDLGGKVYFVVGVNNAAGGQDNPPWMASTGDNGELIGENRAVDFTDGEITLTGNEGDGNNNLGWYFEQTEQAGVYYLVAANNGSTNEGKYLKISAGNNNKGTLTMVENANDASRIEAVAANITKIAENAMQKTDANVICLRTTINGEYWYVNLNGNNNNSNFQSYHNTDEAEADSGNHFVLLQIEAVNKLVAKINTLLDNMVLEEDGDWIFSDAAYVGSALPGNENANGNRGQQGNNGQSHQQPFVDDYDQAQRYRREMQLLARQIRTEYGNLPAEDQKYVWRYEIVDSEGANEKDLEWLWDTVNVVQPNNPTGVKVNLFNYDGSVNDSYLADQLKGENNGFTFYHKVQYDEYTQVDTGRDSDRGGGTLGSDDSLLTMHDHLVNGYPSISGGRNYTGTISEEDGSLAYLFTPNNQYWQATMNNGGGLFQRDADGYYYYYANRNAAWYDQSKNQFVLYDTVIRPMYNHGVRPNQVNDVYNFLPFNNPYDDLIFDEYNSIMSNTVGTDYTEYPHSTNTKDKAYEGVAANAANTARSGYLNERSDMWFGMTIEFDFLMSEDGQLNYYDENGNLVKTTDMIFDFYGDDDVWVYVDDKLVLDIGGVHEAQGGSINFHTGEVKYQDSQAEGGEVNTTIGEIFEDNQAILADVDGDGTKETFADYTPHTLKFFYMERGGNVSYCGLKFNMPILPVNFLIVDKQLAEKDGEDNLADVDVLGDKYYTFRVVQAEKNDEGKLVPKKDDSNKYMSFFDEYTPFNIYKGGAPTGGFGLVDADGYFTIQAGYQAMFENVLQHRLDDNVSDYIVMEVFFNEDKGQYEEIIYTVETVGETNGNHNAVNQTPNFDLDLDFIDQSIHGNAEIGSVTQTTGVDASQSQTVKFTNVLKPPLGELAVTKELAEGVEEGHENDEFIILIELGDYAIVESSSSTAAARAVVREVVYSPIPNGTEYVLTKADGTTENMTVTSGNGTIKLKPGETATFTGIAAGTFYRISEQLTADDNWTPTYAGVITKQSLDEAGNVQEDGKENKDYTSGSADGQFEYGDKVQVTITNQNYSTSAEIPLRKVVEYGSMTDNFTFLVQNITGATNKEQAFAAEKGYYTVPGTNITVTPAQAAAGVDSRITLGFSDSALSAMEGGSGRAYYKISEQPGNGSYVYDDTYYIVEVSLTWDDTDETGTAEITNVWNNNQDEVETLTQENPLVFTNHRTTSVVIDKEVIGGSTADEFEYSYKIKYPDVNTTYKSGSFKLNSGEEYTISGVPIGAIVEVTETDKDDYLEYCSVEAVYEAEYGTISGASVAYEGNPSAGAYVGYINGSTQTITLPVYTNADVDADYTFRFAQQASRSFVVTKDKDALTFAPGGTGDWHNWKESTEFDGHSLEAGENNLIIGGSTNADAPNLDYLKIDFAQVEGRTAAVNVMGDGAKIHFVNEPLTSVTVKKTVNGANQGGTYTFNYTVTDPDGKTTTGNLELKHGESKEITGIRLGSLITVTETNTAGLVETSMQVTTRIEAEDGKPDVGVSINSDVGASGGKWAGNINATGTLTYNDIKVYGNKNPSLNLFYMQDDARHFNVRINDTDHDVTGEDCNTWTDWTLGKTVTVKDAVFAGTNTIVVSGRSGYAPNLDYMDIVWPAETFVPGADGLPNPTVTQYVNGETTIEVVNTPGVALPSTGGAGTTPYTVSGWLLLLAAAGLMMYSQKRYGKEGKRT